jgi:hypothetical protein
MKKYYRVKKERNILHTTTTTTKRKAKGIGHMLHRNCLLKQVIKGKLQRRAAVMGRCKKLQDCPTEIRG